MALGWSRAGLAAAACVALSPLAATGGEGPAPVDNVAEWNAVMVSTVSGQNPFAQARFAAITQLAVFEAVNSITRRYEPYLGAIPASPAASQESAVVAAAHTVLRTYFPAAAPALDAQRAASLAVIPDGPAKLSGIAVGEAAASAIMAHRAADGSGPPAFHQPASLEPGEWQPTPSCPAAGGVLKHWGLVTPFGIDSASQFRSSPPPDLDSRRYARDFVEVREGGALDSATRSRHQTVVAGFYNVVLAVATWNPAVRQVAATRKMTLSARARLFALLNMAISDGLVAVMDTKYATPFWRPETAIHRADEDGNKHTTADPLFQPLIPAPCFPSYGSAHAAGSYAAREIAETFFGDEGLAIALSHPAVPDVVLEYEAFEEITDDIDTARIYGGIHFRFDQRAGARQGRRVGSWVYRHHLRPVHAHDR